jgi:hypothetical protein
MRRKILCGATTRRGTPCQCKAIETKRGAWRCKLHGGRSTGPTSAEGRARIAAAARARHARARGNPLVSIIVTADAFLPLNAAGDVPHDWQAAGETSQVTRDTALMAPADLAASLVDKGKARLGLTMPKHVCGALAAVPIPARAMQGDCDQDQARRVALPAAWRPIDRPQIPRREGAHSCCSSRTVARWAAYRAGRAAKLEPQIP